MESTIPVPQKKCVAILSQEIEKKWKIQVSMMSILMKKSVILRTQNVTSLATLEKHGIDLPTKETKGKQ